MALSIDLKNKRAFVAGVGDDGGFGFAIAKALVEAGATVCVGTWPPILKIFKTLIRRKMDKSLTLSDGSKMAFEQIVPFDAMYDTLDEVPEDVRTSRRYRDCGDFSISGATELLKGEFGEQCFDIVVHSLANGPEVKNPLLETSRGGYLSAVSASAYSFVSLVQHFGPMVRPGGSFLCLSYLAAEGAVPGYGGGMSSAKAALESDTRLLAYEAGRKWGHRINAISAGPYASRAASAIGVIGRMTEYYEKTAPLTAPLTAEEVGQGAAFLCSPLASGITGTTLHIDHGYHAMAVPSLALPEEEAGEEG